MPRALAIRGGRGAGLSAGQSGVALDLGAIRDRCEAFLAEERPNWPGWLALALGVGIAVYVALPVEPPLWLGLALTAGGLVLAIAFRTKPLILVVMAAVMAGATGFGVAQ